MNRFFLHIALVLLLGFIAACHSSKSVSEKKDRKESGEVEPEQLKPEVDTRFQEKFFQAQLEKAKGNPQQAYDIFQECLKIEPDNAACHYEIGKADLEVLNNPAAAMEHAKQCVESDKTNPWYQMLLADAYVGLAKYDLAIKAYKEVYKLNPDDPNILYKEANAQLYASKFTDAIATYDELENKSGVYEELSLQKHQLYIQMKNPEKAGLELEKLAKAFPDEPRYWAMAAHYYQQSGQVEKTEYAMQQLVKSDPENGQVHYQLSEYYATKGEDSKSYEELKKAFESTDVDIDQKMVVMVRYMTLTDMKPEFSTQAYDLLDILIKTHPTEAKAYSMYGDFLYRDVDLKEALSKYKSAITLDPSRKLVWEQILMLESELQDFDLMKKDSEKALELFPTIPEFYYYNGMAYQRMDQYAKAIEAYSLGKELVIENDILLSRFYSSLGETYHYNGQHEKSDESYEESIRIEPSNVFVLNNYAYYLSLRKAKLEKAAEMSKLSNELSPGTASFEDTYAWILFQQGNYTEAYKWIEKALAHGDRNGELLEHEGDILFKQGKTQEALERWKEALKAGGASDKIQQKVDQQKFID